MISVSQAKVGSVNCVLSPSAQKRALLGHIRRERSTKPIYGYLWDATAGLEATNSGQKQSVRGECLCAALLAPGLPTAYYHGYSNIAVRCCAGNVFCSLQRGNHPWSHLDSSCVSEVSSRSSSNVSTVIHARCLIKVLTDASGLQG